MCNPDLRTSVADFHRPEELLQDLLAERESLKNESSCCTTTDTCTDNATVKAVEDWALTQINVEDTRVQTLQDEMQRLQVLKSYNVAGVEGVDSIDRLVQMASSIFNMPLSVVSLVDLRRLWFLSTQGFGELREIPRKDTLCSHSICNMQDILIVPDCATDFRFKELFTVTGEPHLRFYAGAAITSPEGYNIGNFCVLDTKPHPEGLSPTQIQILKDFAKTAMQLMVDRRYKQDMETTQKPLIANTAHELMTPLSGLNLSLSVLQDDEGVKKVLDEGQHELLTMAASCSTLMTRICRSMLDQVRKTATSNSEHMFNTNENNENNAVERFVKTSDLITSLNQIIRPIPKRVPVLFQVGSEAASASVRDDLSVFRVALSFVSIACARTEQGSIVLKIALQDNGLMFECNDTSNALSLDDQKVLFDNASLTVSDSRLMGYRSAASLLDSLGGRYGYRPPTTGTGGTGVFWFCIPKPLIKTTTFPMGLLQPTTTGARPVSQEKNRKNVSPIPPSKSRLPEFFQDCHSSTIGQNQILFKETMGRCSSLPSDLRGALFRNNTQEFVPQKNATLFGKPLLSPIMRIGVNRPPVPTGRRQPSARGASALPNAPGKPCPLFAIPQTQTPAPPNVINEDREDEHAKASWNRQALVIDDSLVIRKGLSRLLSKNGYEVVTAENGQEGLDAMKAKMFDFVLCDFLMPVMDGLDCVQQFRAWEKSNRPGFYQCIFGISAHADTKDMEKGLQIGMDEYFTKPVPLKVIKELPDSAIALRRKKCSAPTTISSFKDSSTTTGLSGVLLQSFSKTILEDTARQAMAVCGGQRHLTCLVASVAPDPTVKALDSFGWKCVKAHSSKDALHCLKQRNWDAVLIDSHLAPLGGVPIITTFREWEQKNRMNRQSNVFLKCHCLDNASDACFDETASIQAPLGFDGVIQSERFLDDFRGQVKTENDRHSGIGSSLCIITH